MSLFSIDQEKCKRDGFCAAECPGRLITMETEGGFPAPIKGAEELCINCGHCVAVCPHAALSLEKMGSQDCPPVRKELHLNPEQAEHFLRFRRSIRKYQERPVDRPTITKLIEMARYAPTGHNSQLVRWLVIEGGDRMKEFEGLVMDWMRSVIENSPKIAELMHFNSLIKAWEQGLNPILRGAPQLIVAYGPQGQTASQSSCIIALTYLELAATSLELGTCWAGYFTAAATVYSPMCAALALPEGHQVFGGMMVGYPKHVYHRLPLRNIPPIEWR